MGGASAICGAIPRHLVWPDIRWDGKLLSEHLRLRYGVKLGVRVNASASSARWGFRLRKPRSKWLSPTGEGCSL